MRLTELIHKKIDSYEHKCNTTADQLEKCEIEFRVAELWSVLRLIEGIKQEADHGRK